MLAFCVCAETSENEIPLRHNRQKHEDIYHMWTCLASENAGSRLPRVFTWVIPIKGACLKRRFRIFPDILLEGFNNLLSVILIATTCTLAKLAAIFEKIR